MKRLLIPLLFLFIPLPLLAAPEAELWPLWREHDPESAEEIDHAPWQTLLDRYAIPGPDGIMRFAYGQVTEQHRGVLDEYIRHLAGLEIRRFNRAQQMAFWINLYNALTVQVILRHYPVESIRDIDLSPGWFTNGPWEAKLIRIQDEAISLDDIEHRILRPIWRDPRIHYAVNCASLGCPDLAAKVFQGPMLEEQLEQAAKTFINHPRAVRIEKDGLTVSSIYRWFGEDFGDSKAAILDHLRQYAAPGLKSQLGTYSGFDRHAYDWRLNDLAPQP